MEPKFVEFTTKMALNKIDGSILINSVLPDGTRYKIEVRMLLFTINFISIFIAANV